MKTPALLSLVGTEEEEKTDQKLKDELSKQYFPDYLQRIILYAGILQKLCITPLPEPSPQWMRKSVSSLKCILLVAQSGKKSILYRIVFFVFFVPYFLYWISLDHSILLSTLLCCFEVSCDYIAEQCYIVLNYIILCCIAFYCAVYYVLFCSIILCCIVLYFVIL